MSKKSEKIARLIEGRRGGRHDAHYLGYFECFNREWFYEAHDVLEELWLADRQGPNYAFYKGLIQLAGAYVHLQKDRLRPAGALFRLARKNLREYPEVHEDLEVAGVLQLIEKCLEELDQSGLTQNPLKTSGAPKLGLREGSADGS